MFQIRVEIEVQFLFLQLRGLFNFFSFLLPFSFELIVFNLSYWIGAARNAKLY